MRGLVERVELEPALRDRHVAGRLHQPRQHRRELAPQRVRLGALPVLELGRVAEPEALQELPAEQRRGARHVAVLGERAEAVDVDGEPGPADEADLVAGGVDEVGADGRAQRRQRPPQRAPRVLRVVLGPQQLGEHVARTRPVGQREHGEQRERLARVERDRGSVAHHARGSEQHYVDRRHRAHRNDSRTGQGEAPPTMTTFEHTAQILRPPEEVFAFLAQPANLPCWQSSLIAVRPHRRGPLRPGVEVTETRRFLGRVMETTWVCTEHSPSRRSVIESDEGPVPFRGIWELEAAGETTRFTWTLETGGLAARLANAVTARLAREQLAADTLRLKELLEER